VRLGKTWRWFTVRLFGLSTDSRTWRALAPAPAPEVPSGGDAVEEIDDLLGIDRDE
jgi:hypothetical protein